MAEQIPFALQDLYKTLKKHDADILKHFDDDNLDDNSYLFYAINSDIMSNALSMVINMLIGNDESIGIDNNCRAIIESFVLLKMLASGAISKTQQKIFRNHFAIVDYYNFEKIIKNQKNYPATRAIKKRYDEAINYLRQQYNYTEKELSECFVSDPLFYLKKEPKDNIGFARLLNKHSVFNEHKLKIYKFYSIMVHPRFILSNEIEEAIQLLRKNYTNIVLKYVFDYLKNCKLIIVDDNHSLFDDDFFHNSLIQNNVNNISQTDLLFDMLKEDLCVFKGGYDGLGLFYFNTIHHLIKDMMLCESLGYNEQVISKFKSFVELSSVHGIINCADSLKGFNCLKKAFNCSSLLQMDEHINSIGIDSEKCKLNELQDLYENYYKSKYNIPTYEEFEKGMRNNSLYFLNPKYPKHNYSKYVKDAINKIFADEKIRKKLFELYKLSNDMNHASGYNFNSRPGISDYYSHLTMYAVYTWLINLIINSIAVVEENDHKTKYSISAIKFFKDLAKQESDTLLAIGKKYEDNYNKYSNQ